MAGEVSIRVIKADSLAVLVSGLPANVDDPNTGIVQVIGEPVDTDKRRWGIRHFGPSGSGDDVYRALEQIAREARDVVHRVSARWRGPCDRIRIVAQHFRRGNRSCRCNDAGRRIWSSETRRSLTRSWWQAIGRLRVAATAALPPQCWEPV